MIRKQVLMVIFGLAFLLISIPVSAGVPDSLVSFQGELQNTNGTPIPDGLQTIIFSLYTQPDGGVAVWSEIQDVTVSGGLFSVLLGRHTPFHNFTFDNDSLFLATQVAGGSELSPRLRLGTVPYATKSARVDGDVVTQPGSMEIWSPQSNTSLRLRATDEAASIAIDEAGVHLTQLVTPDSLVVDQSADFGSSSAGNELHLSSSGARRNYHYAHVDAINEIDEDCDGFAAKHAINTKGTGGTRTMSVSSTTDLSSASSVIGGDLDGDGLPDLVVSNTIVPEAASVAIKTKGTGADKDRVVATCSTGTGGMASLVCDHDSDGDGVPEQEISSVCIPTSSRMAIKTKGTGAAHNRTTIISTTGLDSATVVSSYDNDGDGIRDTEFSMTNSQGRVKAGAKASTRQFNLVDAFPQSWRIDVQDSISGSFTAMYLESDEDGDGIPDDEAVTRVIPGTSYHAIKTKGTGADANRSAVVCSTTTENSTIRCDHDSDGDGLADRSVSSTADDSASVVSADQGGLSVSLRTRKGWDGTIKGNMRVSNGSVDVVDLDSDGDGFFAGNVGIGMPATTHHIEVAGGAYCDGSNWVNASDADLKENFSEVNGEELLSKIEELTVTEWNYKNEGSQVKHIGPTAQDFQKTFGVGSDGKSISTIDPSGIALAAIKELNKQNQQLQNQNSELQQRLEELQKKVDKLISRQ